MVGKYAHSDEDELGADVSVDDTSDHDSRERDTVGDSPQSRASVTEGRRDCIRASEGVHDNADDQVDTIYNRLAHDNRFEAVSGLSHLYDHGKESGSTTE